MEEINKTQETDIEALARIVKDGFDRMDHEFAKQGDRFAKLDERLAKVDARLLSAERGLQRLDHKIDQLDQKLDHHRQETRDGFAALHRLVGGMAHTLADHEERIKTLEGE